nr:AzlD domain-containing protein [Paracoccus sp. MC1854]
MPICAVVPVTAALWVAFVAIGAVTYLTRALPLLRDHPGKGARPPPAWMEALGPCILAAIAVAVLLPEARGALAQGSLRPFLLGAAAAGAAMRWRRDAGLATLAGVAAYWLAL